MPSSSVIDRGGDGLSGPAAAPAPAADCAGAAPSESRPPPRSPPSAATILICDFFSKKLPLRFYSGKPFDWRLPNWARCEVA